MNDTRSVYAEVNGARLYFEVRGEGHSLLLLHAGVADSRMWDDQFCAYSEHYQVVRFDMRGYGRTVVPAEAYSAHDDAAGLLSHLGIERCFVVGVSFGGKVAIDLALAYPDLVDALVLSAPAVGGYEPVSEEMARFIFEEDEAWARGDLVAATEVNLRMWVDGPNRTSDQVNPMVRERVREMQMHAFGLDVPEAAQQRSLAPPAITRLKEIRVPTLVIVGDQDVPEFHELAQLVAAGIPGASRVFVPGAAHLPSMEKPEQFNRIVLGFLRDIQYDNVPSRDQTSEV